MAVDDPKAGGAQDTNGNEGGGDEPKGVARQRKGALKKKNIFEIKNHKQGLQNVSTSQDTSSALDTKTKNRKSKRIAKASI